MTRFTLMVAMVAIFSSGSVFAMIKPAHAPMQGQQGTVKATIIEHGNGKHGNGKHVHFHDFKGMKGPKTLFSLGGTFTLFPLSSMKDLDNPPKPAGDKAMGAVGDAIASGEGEEKIKHAADKVLKTMALK